MNILTALFSGILFFLLSPNILLRLPKNGSKFMVAGVHACVFGFILYFVQGFVYRMSLSLEAYTDSSCKDGTEEDEGEYSNATGSCKKRIDTPTEM